MNMYIEKINTMIMNVFTNPFWSMLLIYIVVWVSHYISAICYVHYCTPMTIWGFFMSPFLVVSPQCITLRWIIWHGSNHIKSMWVVIGLSIINYLRIRIMSKFETDEI